MRSICSCAILLCAMLGDSAYSQDTRCRTTAIEGHGARLHADGGIHILQVGPLPLNITRIETGPARVEMSCRGGLVVTIGTDTTLDPGSLAPEEPGMLLRLMHGIVGLARPAGADDGIAVKTDLAIAAARSTEWLVSRENATTAVFVREGVVAVDSLAQDQPAVRLEAGDGVDATADGLGPVVRWGDTRIVASGAALGHGWR